jgi:hypothetical protein
MTEAAFWWVNTVTVSPYLGTGVKGPTYGAPVQVACWIEDEVKLVRHPDGSEVVSSASIYLPLSSAGNFPTGSKVVTPSRTAFVITNNRFDSGTLGLGIDHAVVTLT